MAFKVVFVFAFAIMVQSIAGKCCKPQSKPKCGCGSSGGSVTVVESVPVVSKSSYRSSIGASSPISISGASIDIPQSGGPLVVTSVGPISPTGIAVATDLSLAGDLVVSGALPYLTAVAFEGQFESEGSVPVSYSCGDVVGITQTIGGSGASGSAAGRSGLIGGNGVIGSAASGRSGSIGVINTGCSGYSGYAPQCGCGCY